MVFSMEKGSQTSIRVCPVISSNTTKKVDGFKKHLIVSKLCLNHPYQFFDMSGGAIALKDELAFHPNSAKPRDSSSHSLLSPPLQG